jgi:hypothetical protein
MSSNNIRFIISTITTQQTLRYTSPHFTQLHFTAPIDTSLHLVYTSLPIYISYLFPPHTTKLVTTHFSRLQSYFQNNEPHTILKEAFNIALHKTTLLIFIFSPPLRFTSLHFAIPIYISHPFTSLHFAIPIYISHPFTSLPFTF